jgi:hypothetical protein
VRKIILHAILCFLLADLAFSENWTREDTYYELTWTALLLVDYGQTRNIVQNPNEYSERNHILSKHPAQAKVDLYMGSCAILHPIISYYLPPRYRKIWQQITVGVEVFAVVNNYSIGLGMKF